MPINREPPIYQGYVISQIGQSMGQRVEMNFKNAQNCVSSGTHRWADDKTDLPNGVKAIIDERTAAEIRQKEADALHYEQLKQNSQPKSIGDALLQNAQEISVTAVYPIENDTETKLLYLARPFPKVIAVDVDAVETMKPHFNVEEGGVMTLTFENAKARYEIQSIEDGKAVAVLDDASQPEVDIPADWRDLSHLKTIPMAKAIRGLDSKAKMSKPEAIAVIEEWLKQDDQVREVDLDGDADDTSGKSQEEGNRDEKPFVDAQGNTISPEESARLKEREFVEDAQND